DLDTQAEAGRHAVIGDLDTSFDSARIAEDHAEELVARQDRHLVFDTIQERKRAAGVESVFERPDAAKRKTAQASKTAGIKPLIHRRFRGCEIRLTAEGDDMLAAAVRPLIDVEV